jgi:hypothetical protein
VVAQQIDVRERILGGVRLGHWTSDGGFVGRPSAP